MNNAMVTREQINCSNTNPAMCCIAQTTDLVISAENHHQTNNNLGDVLCCSDDFCADFHLVRPKASLHHKDAFKLARGSSLRGKATEDNAASMKKDENKKMTPLGADFVPSPYHVICARGNQAKNHQANRFLRSLVANAVPRYEGATNRMEKTVVVSEIIDTTRRQTDDGCCFVKQMDGQWYEISEALAREKVGQMMREKLHLKYKSSTRAKRRKQKATNEVVTGRLNDTMNSSVFMANSITHLSSSIASISNIETSDSALETALTQANLEILANLKTTTELQQHSFTNYKEGLAMKDDNINAIGEIDETDDFIPIGFPFLDDSLQHCRHSLY